MEDLHVKPCPFCGSDKLEVRRGRKEEDGFQTHIKCYGCGAEGPWIYTEDKAVFTCMAVACEKTGWNKRDNAYLIREIEFLRQGFASARMTAASLGHPILEASMDACHAGADRLVVELGGESVRDKE